MRGVLAGHSPRPSTLHLPLAVVEGRWVFSGVCALKASGALVSVTVRIKEMTEVY